MAYRIAVGGSAANPPQIGHQALINALVSCGRFDEVIWIPSGSREDKKWDVDPDHRVAMTELTFPNILRIRSGTTLTIKYDDVYSNNTPTINRLRQLSKDYPDAEIYWYTGVDSIVPKDEFDGRCTIEEVWTEGEELMRNWKFIILPRVGYTMPKNLTPNFEILDVELPDVSSSEIRELIEQGQPFEHLVTIEVAEYIKRFNLYNYRRRRVL